MANDVYCRHATAEYFDRKTGMTADDAIVELEKLLQPYGGNQYSKIESGKILEADYSIPRSGRITAYLIKDEFRRFTRDRFHNEKKDTTADTAIVLVKRNDELVKKIREALGAHTDRHIIYQ